MGISIEEAMYILQLDKNATLRFIMVDEGLSSRNSVASGIEERSLLTIGIEEGIAFQMYAMTISVMG